MKAFILLGLMVATPATAADQFDLICTAKKASDHYRINLATGEYCWGKCEIVEKIASVTAGTITLMDLKPEHGGTEARKTVNRATGEWYWYNYSPRYDTVPTTITGTCELAPFSGFPAAKF